MNGTRGRILFGVSMSAGCLWEGTAPFFAYARRLPYMKAQQASNQELVLYSYFVLCHLCSKSKLVGFCSDILSIKRHNYKDRSQELSTGKEKTVGLSKGRVFFLSQRLCLAQGLDHLFVVSSYQVFFLVHQTETLSNMRSISSVSCD
jgi:hypothetical protein